MVWPSVVSRLLLADPASSYDRLVWPPVWCQPPDVPCTGCMRDSRLGAAPVGARVWMAQTWSLISFGGGLEGGEVESGERLLPKLLPDVDRDTLSLAPVVGRRSEEERVGKAFAGRGESELGDVDVDEVAYGD